MIMNQSSSTIGKQLNRFLYFHLHLHKNSKFSSADNCTRSINFKTYNTIATQKCTSCRDGGTRKIKITSSSDTHDIHEEQHTHKHIYTQAHTRAHITNNPSYVNSKHAPKDFHPFSAIVYDNFISSEEGNILQKDIFNIMKRKRFEKGHWDAVITNYKEVELPMSIPLQDQDQSRQQQQLQVQKRNSLSRESYEVIEKVRRHIEQAHFGTERGNDIAIDTRAHANKKNITWLPAHAIHLKENGILSAHVDSVKFSGNFVAGLSLLSPSIMRLKPASPTEISSSEGESDHESHSSTSKSLNDAGHVDLYLPPLSLYVLSDMSRYKYTHELLDSGQCFSFNNDDNGNEDNIADIVVKRKDRISVIFRDAKE